MMCHPAPCVQLLLMPQGQLNDFKKELAMTQVGSTLQGQPGLKAVNRAC